MFMARRSLLSRFGPDPLAYFQWIYGDVPPWDIGTVQPAMADLLNRYPPKGPVLDVGCGPGDLSMYLALRGYEVTGIDFIETAITSAREKANALPAEVSGLLNFQVADALKPSILGQRFGAVVDSGFYHLFDPEQGEQFIDDLALALLPSGRYYLHEFAVEFPVPNMPRSISADELQARFTAERGWQIKEIQPVEFLSRVAPPVPAICACIERLPG